MILHAAGYHVPYYSVAYFPAEWLHVDQESYYRDATGKRRAMTTADLENGLRKLKTLPDGRYRGSASHLLPGKPVGKFLYNGTRRDDPNDQIPHESRRELRGLRVIASWINHADVGDKNTQDMYLPGNDERKYVKHYLLDFGSTLGSGNFFNGPYRVGHEYLFDGPAIGRSFVTLGSWRRPWEVYGGIRYPEVGYYQAELFEPHNWKPNYPNLAFERMDNADAYWGAKIVTAFSDEMIRKLAEAGEYSRAEVTAYVAEVLRKRRDAIGRYWLDQVTPLEELILARGEGKYRLRFRDLAVERGYADGASRAYRLWGEDLKGRKLFSEISAKSSAGEFEVPDLTPPGPNGKQRPADRYARTPLVRLLVQSNRRDGGWARPVEVVAGFQENRTSLEVLGWSHSVR